MPTQQWNTVVMPELGMQFQVPTTTPSGQSVDIDEIRVHIRSRASAEVYFELSRHLLLSAEALYARERGFVTERLQGEVSPLRTTTFGGRPAKTFSFRWAEQQRVVILVERGEQVYRCIYDPHAALSGEVLARIQFL